MIAASDLDSWQHHKYKQRRCREGNRTHTSGNRRAATACAYVIAGATVMHIYIYIYIYMCVYNYIYMCTHIYIYIYTHVCCVYMYMYVCIRIYISLSLALSLSLYIYIYIYITIPTPRLSAPDPSNMLSRSPLSSCRGHCRRRCC